MANTWETLDRGQQMALCRQLGANTPEDHNRIAQYLSQNPQAVDKAMKESGMVEGEEGQELQDGGGEESLESNVDNMMAESASSDVQETGSVASDIPPAEPGESVEEYIQRLATTVAANSNPGNKSTLNDTQAEIGMLQGQERIRQQTQPPGLRFKMMLPIGHPQDL